MDSAPTQVLQCGGVLTYQLLCGREIARGDDMASQLANYCYLIVNTNDRTAIALDAAWDVDGLYNVADKLGVKVRGSIYSHNHFDHCGGELPPMMTQGRKIVKPGAKQVEDRGGRVWVGKEDAEYMRGSCGLKRISKVQDGDVIDCGDLVLHVIHTPGHTPGSICIYAAPRCVSPRDPIGGSGLEEKVTKAEAGLLIAGDTLFVGSCGRTDLPGSNEKQMFGSLSRLSALDPAVVVLPGHNYAVPPFSTIGAERARNQMVMIGMQQFPSPLSLPSCLMCANQKACGPKDFVIGRRVRITGLTSEQGQLLNGQPAVVQTYVDEKERYAVKLYCTPCDVKSLKPDNLEMLGPGEQCDAPEPEGQEAPPPMTPSEFVHAAVALIDAATMDEKREWREAASSPSQISDWGGSDMRWFLLKIKLLNGGSARATFGDALQEVVQLLVQEFDPKWQKEVMMMR